MTSQQFELNILYLAFLLYTAFGFGSFFSKHKDRYYRPLVILAIFGLVAHSISIGIRWNRIGHGPFINLYEILSSNVWSMFLGVTLFFIFFKQITRVFWFLTPVVFIMMLWLMSASPKESFLPPTYNTIWLYFHVITGKFFFTLLFLASGLAVCGLLTKIDQESALQQQSYIKLAYKFLAIAFLFESFMLFFGAIWAQDAWGRYWAWDPLETWAFLTWLGVAFTLHLQVGFKKDRLFLWLILGCFTLAFLTFFGVPFISTAPHKGMI